MLQDELVQLKLLINDSSMVGTIDESFARSRALNIAAELSTASNRIADAWLKAFFSDVPDHSLKRYFQFHLEGITELADTLYYQHAGELEFQDTKSFAKVNQCLRSLIDHAQKDYRNFFPTEANTPLFWRGIIFKRNAGAAASLIARLQSSAIGISLRDCVLSYIKEMMAAEKLGFCCFHALDYYEFFIRELYATFQDDPVEEQKLEKLLYKLNFNRLEFLVYYQMRTLDKILHFNGKVERISVLLLEKQNNRLIPGRHACQPEDDSIDKMINDWLDEQIRFAGQDSLLPLISMCKFSREKIHLNLSVAHIACLIRQLIDENYLNTGSLTDIFEFVADHFSSKRQETISAGSLSKEYYSISQSTAARVQGILQKMVARINYDFFR